MIRYKDIILEEYSIDPVTAIITNSKGEIQKIKIKDGRPYFKRHWLHQWQAHTHYGYKEGYDVHHIDKNKMNNALSNLVYLTHSEHSSIHCKEKFKGKPSWNKGKSSWSKGKILSTEHKQKIGESNKGKCKIKIWITNGIENKRIDKNIPIPDGFRKGVTRKNK